MPAVRSSRYPAAETTARPAVRRRHGVECRCAVATRFHHDRRTITGGRSPAKPVIRVTEWADLKVFAQVYTIADDENNECLPYGVTPTKNEDRRSS
jgi:hypothetical protein